MPRHGRPRSRPLSRFRPSHLVIHYNEVALKGRNRSWFEETLIQNLRLALESGECTGIERLYGRLLVHLASEAEWTEAAGRLARIFGVASIIPVLSVEPTIDALREAAARAVAGETEPRTFGVHCKRGTKDFPFTSMDVQRQVGAAVQGTTGWRVDLEEPELAIQVELVNRAAFLGFDRIEGPGGLPTGVAGRVVCLLSGGIDSPVAAYQILRRGATAAYLHFHSHPYTGIESQAKARDLASKVQPLGRRSHLYLVPFAELQRRILSECPASLRVILYRRFMFRVADAVARKERADAVVTGENLGQVASQTLENLRTIEAVSSLPILRPLIGLDKLEIVDAAKRIGTYEVSIEPHGDCCSFLMPPNPATSSRAEVLEAAEACFDVEAEVLRLVESSAVEDVTSEVCPAPPSGGRVTASQGDRKE